MKRRILSVLFAAGLCLSAVSQTAGEAFGNALWIALEADSSIVFPHIHFLSPESAEGRSLKVYKLPVLEKSHRLEKGRIRRAWVDICGMGQYELFINGKKVSDYFLSPGWTKYDTELLYNEFDVTDIVRDAPGRRLDIKVMLGGGMYDIPTQGYHKFAGSCGAPKLLFCLHVEYTNGKVRTVVSDGSWSASAGPVRFSSIFAGEWHDASFGAGKAPATVTRPKWDVPLVRQQEGTFVKIQKELPMTKRPDGLYDMGQNCSGIVRIKVRGERGKNITLRPGEILQNGKVDQRCMPGYEWKYTLRGEPDGEVWQPQFTYTGFRYADVQADEGVEILEITGLHTSIDAQEVGSFECSDTLFNQIHSLIDWAIRSNLVSIATDCPTREKLGWQEQCHLMGHSMMYRFDMRPLMNKIADDLAASQYADGMIPTIAPEFVVFDKGSGFEDTPEWGSAFILCPWYTYQWYGDDSALTKHYDAMKRYIRYLQSRANGGIVDYGLGDWYDMGPQHPGKAQLTSVALSATAMYYYDLTTMRKIAGHLGKKDDAEEFARLADEVKLAFNRRFATGDERVYENGSQTALAMALYMDLVTEETRQDAIDALVADIEKRGFALTAGDVGFRYVVQALQQNNRGNVIYRMNHNETVPGYAYQLRKGATALTESWQAYEDVSNNHLMLGHLMEWLYGGLGGITTTGEAWKHIVIKPQMVGDVRWVKTSLRTPKGTVSCHWTRDFANNRWTIDVEVPKGSEAEVHFPTGRTTTVGEGKYSFSSLFTVKKR